MLKLLNALLHLAKDDLMFEERGYLVDRNLWQKLFERAELFCGKGQSVQ